MIDKSKIVDYLDKHIEEADKAEAYSVYNTLLYVMRKINSGEFDCEAVTDPLDTYRVVEWRDSCNLCNNFNGISNSLSKCYLSGKEVDGCRGLCDCFNKLKTGADHE